MIHITQFEYNKKCLGVKVSMEEIESIQYLKGERFHRVDSPLFKGWLKTFKTPGEARRFAAKLDQFWRTIHAER